MSKAQSKDRLPPFVPLLITTLDAPAWKAMSVGARILYAALKRHVPKGRNTGYLSHRDAAQEIGASRPKIAEWFKELEHYGFIVLSTPGCLGVEGKGKSPVWRLTEKGVTSKGSARGVYEDPTNDFLKWDRSVFDPTPLRQIKNKTLAKTGCHPGQDVLTTPGQDGLPPIVATGQDGVAIQRKVLG
jgi:hypothetical protein